MNERQAKLLAAIIDQFIETALPVGSKRLLETVDFSVCSATIRNEMNELETSGFLLQPHVSAGRIPTAKGYRMYVQEFMQPSAQERAVRKKFESLVEQYGKRKDQERAYEAVALLSRMMPNIAFATAPHKDRVYYLGLANALRQPEFQQDPMLASGVVEIIEERLHDVLSRVEIDDTVRYYIGEVDILPQLQSCSLMVRTYHLRGASGVLGILGPMRMEYAYNRVALDLAVQLLHSS